MARDPRIRPAPDYKDGRKRWWIRWREADGRHIRATFSTYGDAKAKLDEVNAPKTGGRYTSVAKGRQKLGDYFETWFGDADLEETTRALYRGTWDRYVAPELGGIQLAKLTRVRVKAWVTTLREAGVGAPTIAQAHKVLRRCLNEAIKDDAPISNVAAGIEVPSSKPRKMLPLDGAQVTALAETVPTRDRALVLFLSYLGARFGEASFLRVRNVDILRRRVLIDGSASEVAGHRIEGSTKTDRERSVTLPGFLADELTAHLARFSDPTDPDALVFTAPEGGPIRLANFRRRVFNPAQVTAGIDPLRRVHDLRHTAASLAIASGALPQQVANMLGHARVSITLDRYAHLFPSAHEELADRLDQAYRGAATRPPADAVSLDAARDMRDRRTDG